MGMKIEKSFVVDAPRDAVWDFLTDPREVASCLPGAAISEQLDDSTYKGTMTVKVGPVVANYRGTLKFVRLDREAGEAELSAAAQETRGKGAADMRMHSRVVERDPSRTEVVVTSDVNVVGVLAQFGRGMIDDVGDQLFEKFSGAMRRKLEGGAGEAGGAASPGGDAADRNDERTAVADEAGAASDSPPAVAAGAAASETAPTAPTAAATSPPAAAAVVPAAQPPARAAASPRRDQPPREDVLDLGSYGAAAAGRAVGRALRNPAFWIAVAALALVVYWLVSR